MTSIHFYTVTIRGKKYRASAPYYQWAKVEDFFDIPRSQIRRGAQAGLPYYLVKEHLIKEQE